MIWNPSSITIRLPVRVYQSTPQALPENLPLLTQRVRLLRVPGQRPLDVRLGLHQVAQRLWSLPLRNVLQQNQHQTLTTRLQKSATELN